MAEATFFRCAACNNLVALVEKGTCTPQCCGTPMERLEAGVTDAAAEKHVPSVTRADGRVDVKVGEVAHPMVEAHHIDWVALSTAERLEIRHLDPLGAPAASFVDEGEQDLTIYAYCNLHGLWKA